jgi:hypothetical protein
MKEFKDLNLGFVDAENYLQKDSKSFFDKVFFKDENLEKLLRASTFFLIGEKGTGKTAYSVFLSNNDYKNTQSSIKYIRETDYTKFIELKKLKQLTLSDFSSVWKVIILLLISMQINEKDLTNSRFQKKSKYLSLLNTINDYYDNAFSPEIVYALEMISTDELLAKLKVNNAFEAGATSSSSVKVESRKFRAELFRIERDFKAALSELKLSQNILLFIDGIDIRPSNIEYDDYLECIKGLADAMWSLNKDFFANIKDSTGRLKAVMLVRPDIFNSLGFQNDANKVYDNAVYLDWRTTYPEYRESRIFRLIDRLLSAQQEKPLEQGVAWDYYFPWSTPSTNYNVRDNDPAFISFLRFSYSRPRDIIAALQIIKKDMTVNTTDIKRIFQSDSFKRQLSEYYLRSIKNQTSFYYTDDDYDILILFFDFITAPQFEWDQYCQSFAKYIEYLKTANYHIPSFASTKEKFLQFLYDNNIICYIEYAEQESFFRWCYRERELSRMSPKVKFNQTYSINYVLHKALNVGSQKIKPK